MASMEELREDVRRCLPEVDEIENEELRARVIEAWALALSRSEFASLEELPSRASFRRPPFKEGEGTQAGHFRATALMALGIADALQRIHPNLHIDRDLLWACALCHDLGKPYEMSPGNQARWKADVATHGYPAIRHPVYGVHLALTAGLPEEVAHAAGAHSKEGEAVERSLPTMLVNLADHAYWDVVERAGLLEDREPRG